MEWKSWLSLPLEQRAQLPIQPGIYIIVDAEDEVWYVGRSTNLNARWNGKQHHRYQQLSRTNNKRSYRIHWRIFPAEQLGNEEQRYIDLLKPHLNYSRVKTYARRAIQPSDEIARLLKTINKKTLLFPDIRSVVLGYYTELDETEEEALEECFYIVIAVTVNDHDGPILKSYKKSLSRKGSSLKGYWQTYASDCGVDSSAKQPALIPVFLSGSIVYEFVCYSNLIERLEAHKENVCTIELARQNVLALKNINLLPSLIVEDGHFCFSSEDYLRYRIPDLRPILELTSPHR